MMIFEKAWAKLHGSFEATAGGWTEDALNYLSAGKTFSFDFDDNVRFHLSSFGSFREFLDQLFGRIWHRWRKPGMVWRLW